MASVTAATWACAAEPTSAPSLIAPTVSADPRSSSSTRTSGRRRWSTIRHTSPSQRNGARHPAVEASSSAPAVVSDDAPPVRLAAVVCMAPAACVVAVAGGPPSSSRAASAELSWRVWAAPIIDPTDVTTSPANCRKKRRRSGSGGWTGSLTCGRGTLDACGRASPDQ